MEFAKKLDFECIYKSPDIQKFQSSKWKKIYNMMKK